MFIVPMLNLCRNTFRKHVKLFPILKINPERKDIGSFVAADFKLIGYDPHDKLEMKMADIHDGLLTILYMVPEDYMFLPTEGILNWMY